MHVLKSTTSCCFLLLLFFKTGSAGQFYSFALTETDHILQQALARENRNNEFQKQFLTTQKGFGSADEKMYSKQSQNAAPRRNQNADEVLHLCRFIFGNEKNSQISAIPMFNKEKLKLVESICQPLLERDRIIRKTVRNVQAQALIRNQISRMAKTIRF